MTNKLKFILKTLEKPLPLNATLADAKAGKPRIATARAIKPAASNLFNSDMDGDGKLDKFVLNVVPALPSHLLSLSCSKKSSQCSLFIPDGSASIKQMIPADVDRDGLADLYIEDSMGAAHVLFNRTAKKSTLPDKDKIRQNYLEHLKNVHALEKNGSKEAALRKAATYGVGQLSHTWVMPKTAETPFTWLDGKPPYTDCVIDTERLIAELFSPSGSFNDLSDTLKKVQYYEFKGPERTDFFTTEAVPHLIELGMLTDETERLYKTVDEGSEAPAITGTINKEAWFAGTHNGKPSGKDFEPKPFSLKYIPFQKLLVPDAASGLSLDPKIASALPAVAVMVIVNKDRKMLGTDIPDSHVVYLVRNRLGKFDILHSTPLTDVGLATKTYETVSSFFSARYCTVDGEIKNKDKTAVGVQIFSLKSERQL